MARLLGSTSKLASMDAELRDVTGLAVLLNYIYDMVLLAFGENTHEALRWIQISRFSDLLGR